MIPTTRTFRWSKIARETKQLNIMVSSCSEPRASTPVLHVVTVNNQQYSVVPVSFNTCLTFLSILTAREAAIQKIETIIREQFSLEMKSKEHEIDVISQVSGSYEKSVPFSYSVNYI